MTTQKVAVDTNILVYYHDEQQTAKQRIAGIILDLCPIVSTQVVVEYINVLRRILPLSKEMLIDLCISVLSGCPVHPVELSTLQIAQRLIRNYNFQIFDSLIVASAMEAGCETLYSEDMQHNLYVESRLRIINPFVE
jgi:predicted nucleic acid-binding protein